MTGMTNPYFIINVGHLGFEVGEGGLVVERRMPSEVIVIVDIAECLIQEVFLTLELQNAWNVELLIIRAV
jgi:hypothetical protein